MGDSKEIMNMEDDQNNKFLLLGILIFTIGTFTLNTFISTNRIEAIYLILTLVIFITFYIIQNKGLIIYKPELMWLVFFIYILFNFLYRGNFLLTFYADILVFFMLFLFLLLVKLDINYYRIAMNTMLGIATLYALSVFLQYFNIDLYTQLILPLFTVSEQESILKLYKDGNGTYTGFTSQTAYIAGYLVYGIGILLLSFKEKIGKWSRRLSILVLPLLVISLLLTGKRAHLLFLIIALVLTYLFSIELKKFSLQFIKFVSSFLLIIGVGIVLFRVSAIDKYTPFIGGIYDRFSETIEGFTAGEDITSGRTLLYDYALELFKDTPILGIGWREYSQLSAFIFNNQSGSHPHNIYFQLLTEWGIVGFILFLIPVIYILYKTIKLLMNAESIFSFDMRWKTGLQFSLFSQFFFLLYGFTGNLLTDHMYMLMYIFAASITLSSIKYSKRNKHFKNLRHADTE